MSTLVTRWVFILGTLLALGIVNYSIFAKERIIASGEVIYLELLPVDPRSLMQGDYMALRFQLAQEIESARRASSTNDNRRIAPLHLNDRSIAALGSAGDALHIRYRIRSGQVWLGTNAYFFEEGTAERYTGAKYGEFRLNRTSGEAVLVGLRDEKLQAL